MQAGHIATRRFCAEPEGIMEQEQEYLTALGTAATYRMTGDRMEMRTAEGSIVATFEAAKQAQERQKEMKSEPTTSQSNELGGVAHRPVPGSGFCYASHGTKRHRTQR